MGTVTPMPTSPGPYAALRAVRAHSGATGPPRGVLTVIATYADDEGVSWPSIDTIARDSGYSRSTVHRSIGALVESGELIVTRGGGRGISSRYRIPLSPSVETDVAPVDNPVVKGATVTRLHNVNSVREPPKQCQGDTRTTKELPIGEGVTFPDHCGEHASVENPPPCRGCMRTRQANADRAAVDAKIRADAERQALAHLHRADVEAAKARTAPPAESYLEARRRARDRNGPGRVHSPQPRKDETE